MITEVENKMNDKIFKMMNGGDTHVYKLNELFERQKE